MRIRYIAPLYGFIPRDRSAESRKLCIPDFPGAAGTITRIGKELVGTDDFVAIYIPLSTHHAWRPGSYLGKIAGAVRLTSMPLGKAVTDYYQRDLLEPEHMRWPVGWPCEQVFGPPADECQSLKELVGERNFQPFTHQFVTQGPIKLAHAMTGLGNRILTHFERDPNWRLDGQA